MNNYDEDFSVPENIEENEITVKPEEDDELIIYENNKEELSIEQEYDLARENILHILRTSKAVLENTAELALDTDHPRMVEVYSGLIKNLADINKDLIDLQEKKMKLKKEYITQSEIDDDSNLVNNNAIFVGSTEELFQLLKGK